MTSSRRPAQHSQPHKGATHEHQEAHPRDADRRGPGRDRHLPSTTGSTQNNPLNTNGPKTQTRPARRDGPQRAHIRGGRPGGARPGLLAIFGCGFVGKPRFIDKVGSTSCTQAC